MTKKTTSTTPSLAYHWLEISSSISSLSASTCVLSLKSYGILIDNIYFNFQLLIFFTYDSLSFKSFYYYYYSFSHWIFSCLLLLLFSRSVVSYSLRPHGLQNARLPCPSPSSRACSNSCPWSQCCHPTISSSVVSYSSWLQSFPASGSFLMNWLFASGGQSIGASASASVLPMNIQDWFPLEFTSLIFLLSKGCTRVLSNSTVQKYQFFGT